MCLMGIYSKFNLNRGKFAGKMREICNSYAKYFRAKVVTFSVYMNVKDITNTLFNLLKVFKDN